MTEQQQKLSNLAKYPEFQTFKTFIQDRLREFRDAPLNRQGDVAAQALAKEDAAQFIEDVFSSVELFENHEQKTVTYE